MKNGTAKGTRMLTLPCPANSSPVENVHRKSIYDVMAAWKVCEKGVGQFKYLMASGSENLEPPNLW